MNHIFTIALYIGIIFTTTLLAFSSQRIVFCDGKSKVEKFYKLPFVLAMLIAWFFISFTNIGVDYDNYRYIVQQETWSTFSSIWSVESGFGLVCVLIKQVVGENEDLVLFVIKSITILFTFFTIYNLRKRIVVGYAVFAYMALVYLASFYLISLALALALVFMAMSYFIIKHKYLRTLLLLLVAAQIHHSVYLFIPAFFALFILEKSEKVSKFMRLYICIIYLMIGLFADPIYRFAQSTVPGFHYNNYSSNTFSGTGIMIFIRYIPLAMIIYQMYKYRISEEQKNRLFVFTISSLLFNVLSYHFLVIERMEFLFLSLYVLFIPEVLFDSGIIKYERGMRYKTRVWILYIVYLLFRAYLMFSERVTPASGLNMYQFFCPF